MGDRLRAPRQLVERRRRHHHLPTRTTVTADELEDGSSGTHVRSFARGLSVIRAFTEDRPELTLSDVARETGLTRAAARRFLLTLVDLGYVTVDDRSFRLTPRVLELGYAYLSSSGLPELAQPHLERVAAETGESSSVSVLDGQDVVYVARVATSRIMRINIAIGTRFPAWVTSMGRALLSGFDDDELWQALESAERTAFTPHTVTDVDELVRIIRRVRLLGYALVEEELELGLRSLAVPVRGNDGAVVAAMNLSTHAARVPVDQVLDSYLPALQREVRALEADLHRVARASRR
jgi:IclR family transcriptional regulator, pca regulon regulatory protein